jgi:hypothetical protein
MLSGILGLIWFSDMDIVDSEIAPDLGAGLECVKANLINFVFAALILGLTCSRGSSHHTTVRGVITSLLHEGAGGLLYRRISGIEICIGGFAVDLKPFEFEDDSSYQNTAEYIGVILGLIRCD